MNIALILSGGTGTRLGADVPKQYIEVNNKPVIAYAIEAFLNCNKIDRIHIVAEERWMDYIKNAVNVYASDTDCRLCKPSDAAMIIKNNIPLYFSHPGENRQLSILNGLRDIIKYADSDDNVIIHDAARPFVKVSTIEAIIEKLDEYEAVTPALPVKDTLYYFNFRANESDSAEDTPDAGNNCYDGGRFLSTADRSSLVAGQTPEGFKLGKYLAATEALLPERIKAVTGSLQVALDGGLNAAAVCGDEDNFKITTQKDLDRFISIVSVNNNYSHESLCS